MDNEVLNKAINILKIYLNNSNKYKELKNKFKNNKLFEITLEYEKENITLSKSKIIIILNNMYEQNLLNNNEIKKYNYLKNIISEKALLKRYRITLLKYKDFYVPIYRIIGILLLEQKDFEQILSLEKIYNIDNIDLRIIINKFLLENKVLHKYYLPNYVLKNIENINKIKVKKSSNTYKPDYLINLEINENLKNNILNKIPTNFNKLEKAFYSYYLLCKTLTYDEEQFLANKKYYDDYTIDHSDITRLSKIDEFNNRVVCFEFIAIYAKILESLNIEYSYVGSNQYAKGHVYLNLYIDKYKIKVDSTDSIVNSDMSLSKNNIRLKGFNINNNESSIEELNRFNKSINNIYDYIEQKENNKHIYNFKKNYNNIKLRDEEKLRILFNKIKECNLPTMDSLIYILNIYKNYFEKDNFAVYFIKNNYPNNELDVSVSAVFVYNANKITDKNTNKYFIYDFINNIYEISLEELNNMFINNKYNYIGILDKNIPGVNKSLKLKSLKKKR